MKATSPGWSRLGRLTLALILLSTLSGVAFVAHAIASGTIIPYQDPTPERREYERFHDNVISKPLFLCSGISGLASVVVGSAWVVRWAGRVLRAIRGGSYRSRSSFVIRPKHDPISANPD